MFPVFSQHAQVNAPLLFTSGPSHGEALGKLQGETLYHASLAPEKYQYLLAKNGFQVVKMIANDPECTGHTVWLAQKYQ